MSTVILEKLPIVLLAEVAGSIVGCLALRHDKWWWSGGEFITDMVFFLSSKARGTNLARELLGAGERYAASRRAPLLIGVLSGEDVLRKDLWFRRRGYRALGGLYLREGSR